MRVYYVLAVELHDDVSREYLILLMKVESNHLLLRSRFIIAFGVCKDPKFKIIMFPVIMTVQYT